ncbi:YlcI/YnfO family protein [Asaia sp. HN128]
MAKTIQISVRVDEDLKESLDRAAEKEERTVAQWVRSLINRELRRIDAKPEGNT